MLAGPNDRARRDVIHFTPAKACWIATILARYIQEVNRSRLITMPTVPLKLRPRINYRGYVRCQGIGQYDQQNSDGIDNMASVKRHKNGIHPAA